METVVETLENLSESRRADEINGVGEARFYIQRPLDGKLSEVNASQFGLSEDNDDNFTAFQSALDHCARNPQTKLVIDKGIYYFRSENGLDANNCKGLLIDGNDATFIFSSNKIKKFAKTIDKRHGCVL